MAQIATLKMEDIAQLVPPNMTISHHKQVLVEIKHPAEVYNIFRREANRLPSFSPAHVKNMELISGHWNEVASVRKCSYVVHGSTEKVVDAVAGAVDTSMIMVYKVLDGDLTEHYKNVCAILQTIPMGPCFGFAHWTLVFEKKNPTCPDPDRYLELLKVVTKDVDEQMN